MTQIDIGSPRENHLLARLSGNAFERLLPDLEPIELTLGKVLHEPGQKQVFAYFPTNSIVALIYHTAHGKSAKVAMTGCDGMVGIVQILGSDASNVRAMVQTSGGAWRIRTEALRREFFRGSGLMTQCLRYAQLLMAHMAHSWCAAAIIDWNNSCAAGCSSPLTGCPQTGSTAPTNWWPPCWACAARASPRRLPGWRPMASSPAGVAGSR